MENEAVKAFNAELSSIYESKPPITKTKIQEITKAALKAIKFYKHVVFSVERFLGKCPPEHKIPVLYIIDSIIRQSKHQYKEKDVYAARFQKNFIETLNKMMMCPPSDRPKISRTLNLWISNKVYPIEIIQEFLMHCESHGIETDVERVERLVKGDKANMAIYDGGKKAESSRSKETHHKSRESREDRHHHVEKHRHVDHSQSSSSFKHEACTPPGPPPVEVRLEPSDITPDNGVSEKTLSHLMKKVAVDFGGVFSTDVSLLKKAHEFILPLLKKKIEKTQDERGDNIKQLLSKDFEYSDDEDNADQNEPSKIMTAHEIEGLAEILLRETAVIRHLQELHHERIAALNKVVMENRQRSAQQPPTPVHPPPQQPTVQSSQQGLPGLPNLPPGVPLPGLPGLPPGLQLNQLNPALMNLLTNPMGLPGLPALPALPPGLPSGLSQSLHQGVPTSLPPGMQLPGMPPVTSGQSGQIPFPPNRNNIMQIMQQQQHHHQEAQAAAQFAAQAQAQAAVQAQAHVQAQQDALMKQMEEAQAENAKEDRDRRERDERGTDRGERGDRNVERRREGDRDRRRDRSRSRDRRDRGDRDRDSRRRRSRSRERRGEARDPRERRDSRDRGDDREKERERRRIGLPSQPKSGHLLLASCTVWFGRLPANCGEDEIRNALQEIGEPRRITLVGSKACAYVTLEDRKTAYKLMDKLQSSLTIRGKSVKLSWGVGPGLKSAQSQFGDCWDADKGISQIPHSKLPTQLTHLVDGSWIDVDTYPSHLKGKLNEFARPINNAVSSSVSIGDVKLPPGIPPTVGASQAGFPTFPPGGPNPFMVPPPMLPFPMNVPPPNMQSAGGPRTPNKNDQQAVMQQLAALSSSNPFNMTPSGFDQSKGMGNTGGTYTPRGGFRGGRGNFTPRGGGFRGGRGGGYGGPPGGFRPQNFTPQQLHQNMGQPQGNGLLPFPRGVPVPLVQNDDAQVSSTVSDDAIPLPSNEGSAIAVIGGEGKMMMSEEAMMESAMHVDSPPN